MIRLIFSLVLLALVAGGCATGGDREYRPGQGWVNPPPQPPDVPVR